MITTRTASTDFPGSFALKCSAGREGEGRTLAGAVHMRTAAPSHEQRTFWRAHERPDTQMIRGRRVDTNRCVQHWPLTSSSFCRELWHEHQVTAGRDTGECLFLDGSATFYVSFTLSFRCSLVYQLWLTFLFLCFCLSLSHSHTQVHIVHLSRSIAERKSNLRPAKFNLIYRTK